MEKTVGHHVHDHPSSTPHTQLTTLHVQGGEERRRRSFASFPTEHISPACPFCLGLCPFPPRPSHSPRSVLVSASPLPSCRPSRHSLALLPCQYRLMCPPLPIFACCTDPGPSSPVPPPLFRVFVYCCCDRRHLLLLLSPFLLTFSPPPLAFPLPSSFPPSSLVLSSALLVFSLSPSFSSSSPSSTCVSAPASPSFPPGPLPSLPSQLEFSIPQHPSLSHFPSCLPLFAVPSCMVLFLDSALAPKKSLVPYQAACTYRGPLGRPHHVPVGRLASSARSACAMYLIFEASWAVCGKCVHCQFILSIGDTCTWGCLAYQHQCGIHRRACIVNAYIKCIRTSGSSKSGPR